MKDTEEFNYVVGKYWDDGSSSICAYAYGSQVHYGTMKEAKEFLKYVQRQQNTDADKAKYRIFKVVELERD